MTTENGQIEPKPEELSIEVHNDHNEDGAASSHQIATPPEDRPAPEPEPKPEPEQYVDPRQAIAKRFQASREQRDTPVPSTGDHTDATQLYGQFGKPSEPEPEPEPEPKPQPAPAPASRTFKLKVRHEEKEYSEEEMIALAQKSAAADSYLDDAKRIFETTRTHVSRPHQDGPAPTPATEPDPDDGPSHQTDAIADMVKELQYGDPDQAAEKAKTTITAIVRDAVKQETVDDRIRADTANDLDTYKKFVKDNADLASDKMASAVIRENLLEGYREDLRKIGVPEDKIPASADALAAHHRHYKLQGQPVRTVKTLLDTARADYLSWKGTGPADPKPEPTPQTRVNVSVDRDERRRAIPNNPTRATVPPQMVQQQKPTGQTNRQNAVVRMRMARGQPVAN